MWSVPEHVSPGVLASAATGLSSAVAQAGGDIDRICGQSCIDPALVGQATVSLELQAYCALFEAAAAQTRNDNFGLWFGNRFKPRDLGLLGYAAISAPTVAAAIETLVQLFAHHQQSTLMALSETEAGFLKLEYRIEAPDIVARRQDAELSLGMFLNIFRESCGGRWAPAEVHFEHPRPEAWKEHESAFDAPVLFSQPTNALVFRRDIMAGAMPSPDLKLLSVARMCLQSVGAAPVARTSVADRIRTAVRARLPDGCPSLEAIAEALKIPPSLIHRELGRENLTYKDVVEAVRKDLALMYLKSRELPLSEIAFLLGYSELSAFSRAFSRWMGVSPRDYRGRMS